MAYQEKDPAVYILASKRNGTIYTGVTSDLHNRMAQHKQGLIEGFTKKYNVHMLVYYESHHLMTEAITREHRIKEWRRQWKVRLIESMTRNGWTCLTRPPARFSTAPRMSLGAEADSAPVLVGDLGPGLDPLARCASERRRDDANVEGVFRPGTGQCG
jgi:putative endonuclease